MASQVTLKALGLNYSPNNLALPEGSLLVANDVIIRRDNVVESRRGFKDYSEGLGTLSELPVKQLLQYKNRILAHYQSKIGYDIQEEDSYGQVLFNEFSGSYEEAQYGLRIKSIVANKNLYFTSAEGIKKISAKSASDFPNTQIVNSGGVKAVDFSASLDIQQGQNTGFLPVDSAVAYRVVWGYKDANDNIILGSPSDRIVLYNFLSDAILDDLNSLLVRLDNLSETLTIDDISVNNPTEITTDSEHGLNTGDIVNIVGSNSTPSIDGSFSVTVTSSTKFTIPVNVTVLGTAGTFTKSLFSNGNYYNQYYSAITDTAETIKDNIINLAKKLDEDLLLANNAGLGTPYVPLKMNTVQINTGSIGQVNFDSNPELDATDYFSKNDKIKIDGFTTEPVISNLSLTNVAENENPVSIGYTGSSNITDGQEITITGTNTSGSCNGTFLATVVSSTISSTTSNNLTNSTTYAVSVASAPYVFTSTSHGLNNGDCVYISSVTGLSDAKYFVVNKGTNTFEIASTLGGSAITYGTGAISSTATTPYKEVIITLNTATSGLVVGNFITITDNSIAALNGAFQITTYTSTTIFRILPTVSISSTSSSSGTFRKTTIPVNVSSVTIGTGNIEITTGNNLKLFNNTFTITNVDPSYIQFNIPDNTKTFGATTIDSTATINSYNYTDIVSTGDQTYTIPLTELTISANPTSLDLRTIQNNILRISDKLKSEPNAIICNTFQKDYFSGNTATTPPINPYTTTTAANAKIEITVPDQINQEYFYQLYRTQVFTATGSQSLGTGGDIPVIPNDEMHLVYEGYPQSVAISSVSIGNPTTITTATPHQFVNDPRVKITGTDTVAPTAGPYSSTLTGSDTFTIPVNVSVVNFGTGFVTNLSNVNFIDSYPDDLAQTSPNLYTNPITGEGIQNSNDVAPFAKDINVFKNVTFFANTKTKQRLTPFQLLGTSNIGGTDNDKFTIGDNTGSITYKFVPGVQQQTEITLSGATNDIKASIQNNYFTLSTTTNTYYFWFNYDNNGVDPINTYSQLSEYIPIVINVYSNDLIGDLITKINNAIGSISSQFTVTSQTSPSYEVTVINIDEGLCDLPQTNISSPSYFSLAYTLGDGENATAVPPQILLSQVQSRSQAIDLTARSMVRVINQQPNSSIYAYYLSGEDTSPGIMNLEAKTLSDPNFYVIGCSEGVGSSFTPDISPTAESSGAGVITGTLDIFLLTYNNHGLNDGDKIIISGSNSDPIIDGIYTVNNCTTNTFEITGNSSYISDGSYFAFSKLTDTAVSLNEEKQNRIYYSKTNQPEAVPILNYLDVGSSDKAIVRIMPLRDSLFVFKEDGLYRISGEQSPFVLTLFDSSCILAAPDTLSVSNNIIYGWTVKGISNVTESGVAEISRPIDTEILKISSNRFTNFKRVTWGVGYDSDNSYVVFTNSDPTDEYATIGFRYSDLTNTWTNIKRGQNCGIIFNTDDKLYSGGSEDNIIYQERKNFDRTDYCDSEFNFTIADGDISNIPNKPVGTRIYFSALTPEQVSIISSGDVITQEQILNQYSFNALLDKLDLDPSVGLTTISSSSGTGTTVTIDIASTLNLQTGDYVTLSNTDSIPSLDGNYEVTVIGPTSFSIQVENYLSVQATQGNAKRNYALTLGAKNGDSLRSKLVSLSAYLDSDPGLTFGQYSAIVQNQTGSIASNSADNPTQITTSSPHYLVDGRIVSINGTPNGSIPALDNQTFIVDNTGTFGSSTTFTIPVNVTTPGTTGLTYDTTPNELKMLDIKACFNGILDELDSENITFSYSTNKVENISLLEAVIINVNRQYKYIDVNLPLSWTNGKITIYKAIDCQIVYAPITFGDPLSIKQIFEATMMFDNKAFTKATASFNTDLKPQFLPVTFYGQGNGIFGHYPQEGFGYGFFGGLSNSAPFRTIIPREAQRGRFLTVKFDHSIAREKWALNGITLTGNVGLSSRGYR